MEELYPGKDRGEGYFVDGSANVGPPFSTVAPADGMRVIAGIRSHGWRNLFVHQQDSRQTPSFDFRPLTAQFLYNAIEFDAEFDFCLRSERIGDVTYMSREPVPVTMVATSNREWCH